MIPWLILSHSQLNSDPVRHSDSYVDQLVRTEPVGYKDKSFDPVGQLLKFFGEFVNVTRLPIPEPGVFLGDPLGYPAWKSAFSALIGNHSTPPDQRVHYLKR